MRAKTRNSASSKGVFNLNELEGLFEKPHLLNKKQANNFVY
jgi:hypothetical protein